MKVIVVVFSILFFLACSEEKKNQTISVKDVLKAHQQSQDFHQWIESSHHPYNLIKSHQISCQELQSLSPEQLSVFYTALESEKAKQTLEPSCRQGLIDRVNDYYQSFEQTQKANLNSSRVFNNQAPTRQVPVNAIGGPVFWYGERGGLDHKEVSLTFDDGPHPRLTPKLLDILDEYNVKATFFVLGKNAKAYPEIIKEIVRRGHKLANHSHSHHNLPKYSFNHGVEEIETGFDEILKITDLVEPFFRFPYGAKTSALQKYLKSTDVATFFWDVDTLDWKKTNPQKLLAYSTEQVFKYNNGIVLFHDVQPQTISVMRGFIEELLLNNYRFAQHVSD
ncbi:MAG: polysaccharide deacetylase family protein [Bdellovibrionales bacterium]|nr:polysaccharide deacetylase family protein [Bdellovibrionales bacterium]